MADRCRFDLTSDLGYSYPDFVSESGESATQALHRICREELEHRYAGSPHLHEARRRLDEELALIEHHGLAGFFLLHRDILEMAREVAVEVRGHSAARRLLPPGRGRGSSVGSIVCYLIGLSHVDPVATRLFLGRFLSRDLASIPDIDLDFPRDIREGLILEVQRRYGDDHAALVAAFPTYRVRGAIRDLGKALALPQGEIERMARLTDGWDSGADSARLPEASDSPRWRAFRFLMDEIMGLPRHISQHSGGMVISSAPLVELVPVLPAAMEGRRICQWDKDSCADAGFLKIDLLGLGMLSAVEECVDLIAATASEPVDLSRVGFDDPGVFAEIQAGDTVGVFQIESRAQMQSIVRTRPENLGDLTVQVALVRPGPIVGKAVNPYIARRKRLREDPAYQVPFDHPLLEGPLADTLGVIVYQDQVLEVAIALAGFTAGEAESLRRAMSRKRSLEALAVHGERFCEGATAQGVPRRTAEAVFENVLGFSGFGFPKSHAAAFAILAYQSAWLHLHHPAEFLCALLNEQPMGFYPPATLLRDGERRGVTVLPPEINSSLADCTIEDGAVGIGLGYVKGVGKAAEDVVSERDRGGPYRDSGDLVRRAPVGRDVLAQLARAGALEPFSGDRRRLLWEIRLHRAPESGQLALPLDAAPAPPLPGPVAVGADGGRPRDDAPHHRPASDGAAAPGAPQPRPHLARPGHRPGRDDGDRGRDRRCTTAAGHGQGHRLPADRGRAGHGQRDRAARDLRARPGRRPRRAAARGDGQAGAARGHDQRAGRADRAAGPPRPGRDRPGRGAGSGRGRAAGGGTAAEQLRPGAAGMTPTTRITELTVMTVVSTA